MGTGQRHAVRLTFARSYLKGHDLLLTLDDEQHGLGGVGSAWQITQDYSPCIDRSDLSSLCVISTPLVVLNPQLDYCYVRVLTYAGNVARTRISTVKHQNTSTPSRHETAAYMAVRL